MHREGNLSAFHPEAGGAARIVASNPIHALPQQFRDHETAVHLPQQRFQIRRAGRHAQIVRATGITGGAQVQATRAVGVEDIALQNPIANPLAVLRGHAFRIERRAAQGTRQVRPF